MVQIKIKKAKVEIYQIKTKLWSAEGPNLVDIKDYITPLKWIAKATAFYGGENILNDDVLPTIALLIDFL